MMTMDLGVSRDDVQPVDRLWCYRCGMHHYNRGTEQIDPHTSDVVDHIRPEPRPHQQAIATASYRAAEELGLYDFRRLLVGGPYRAYLTQHADLLDDVARDLAAWAENIRQSLADRD